MSLALAARVFTTSATWEAQNRRLPYSQSQRNSNLVWISPEADPRQESEGKKYTREMKENTGKGGRQGREAGWWKGLLSGFILEFNFTGETVQFSSVAQLCLTLCDPMDCCTLGFPVHHQLPESIQTHFHWVGDAIQLSHPLLSPSPAAFNLSQHQGLFKWVSSSYQVAKVLEFQLHRQSFQWTFRTDLL